MQYVKRIPRTRDLQFTCSKNCTHAAYFYSHTKSMWGSHCKFDTRQCRHAVTSSLEWRDQIWLCNMHDIQWQKKDNSRKTGFFKWCCKASANFFSCANCHFHSSIPLFLIDSAWAPQNTANSEPFRWGCVLFWYFPTIFYIVLERGTYHLSFQNFCLAT